MPVEILTGCENLCAPVQPGLWRLRAALQGREGAVGAAAGDAGYHQRRPGGRTGPSQGPR